MKRIAAIAFDLDGTLVDSAGGIAHALNTALASTGLPPFDLGIVRHWIGDGPDALIARALTALGSDSITTPHLAARLRSGFDAATLHAPMAGSAVFDGIARLLAALAPLQPLVVVTNKPTELARAVLNEAGLLDFFAGVHGADSAPQRKPSPLLIQQAATALRIPAAQLLMVGDASVDIAAASAAGCHAAWAGWGYGHAPTNAPADVWRLSAPHELIALLAAPACAATEH